MTHICVSKLTIIGPNSGFPPGRRHAVISANDGIVYWNHRSKFKWNLEQNSYIIIQEKAFEQNVVCDMAVILSRLQCVKCLFDKPSPQAEGSYCWYRSSDTFLNACNASQLIPLIERTITQGFIQMHQSIMYSFVSPKVLANASTDHVFLILMTK